MRSFQSPRSGGVSTATLVIVFLISGTCIAKTTQADPQTRQPWSTSTLVGTPDPPPRWTTERVYPAMTFRNPITVRDLPTRSKRLVLEKNGRILTFNSSPDVESADVAIDLKEYAKTEFDEKLLSCRDLILSPDFEMNGHLYVAWSIGPFETPGGCRVSRFTLSEAEPPAIDPKTRLDIIRYPSGDHCGTSLRFGPDGMLYLTTGDGSLPFPPDSHRAAQDLRDIRGSVVRVDVRNSSHAAPYRIPDDNPFVGIDGARGEIFAFGFRNGFRSAFNPDDGSFWVADVGWERCELIHRIVKGGNHGWSLREGPFSVVPNQNIAPGLDMPTDLPVDWSSPIEAAVVMPRHEALSITGGVFLSPKSNLARIDPSLAGQYLFGCYVNGRIWSVDVGTPKSADGESLAIEVLSDSGLRMLDFEQFALDETKPDELDVLVVDYAGGGLHRMVPNTKVASATFPTRLSQTGLFTDVTNLKPAPGVVSWTPRSEMFRQGATTVRHAGFPGSEPILMKGKSNYPAGTVAANTIFRLVEVAEGSFENKKIETQIVLFDGLNWDPYTYRWLPDQSDATLVPATGDRREMVIPDDRLGRRAFTHIFGSTSQCRTCHLKINAGPLTLRSEHLQWLFHGKSEPSPLNDLDSSSEPKLAGDQSPVVDRDVRAKAYLNDNCSACHQPAGGASMDLYFTEKHLAKMKLDEGTSKLSAAAMQGDFGLADARLIVPGHPERSVVMYRVLTCGPGRMPRINNGDPDRRGSLLLWDWIASMKPTPAGPDDAQAAPVSTSSTSRLSEAMLAWNRIARLPPAEARREAADILDQETDLVFRGLFEPWLPMDARTSLVGDNPDASALLALKGDIDRGRQWFLSSTSSQCRNCHQVTGTDATVGPSLAGIGTRQKPDEILDQVINPHRRIETAWRTWVVLTVDGDVFQGRQIEAGDPWTIRLADGRDLEIKADEIEDAHPSEKSMMPSGLVASMTAQEVADLLAYLASLR